MLLNILTKLILSKNSRMPNQVHSWCTVQMIYSNINLKTKRNLAVGKVIENSSSISRKRCTKNHKPIAKRCQFLLPEPMPSIAFPQPLDNTNRTVPTLANNRNVWKTREEKRRQKITWVCFRIKKTKFFSNLKTIKFKT